MASLAHLLPGFNAFEEPEDDDFGVIPAADYVVIAIGSGMKPTKNGQGQFLEVVFEVLDGQYKGRKLWSRLNLVNANEQAVKIARREWAQLCRAVGIPNPQDSSEVHNKPLIVTVKVVAGQKREQNEIDKYHPLNGAPGQAPAPAQQPVYQQAPVQQQPVYQQQPQAQGFAAPPAGQPVHQAQPVYQQQPVAQAAAPAGATKAPWQ